MRPENHYPHFMLPALITTALDNEFIPSELRAKRRLWTPIPPTNDKLKPKMLEEKYLYKREEERVKKQKYYFNRHHWVRQLPQLDIGWQVWISNPRTYGKIKVLTKLQHHTLLKLIEVFLGRIVFICILLQPQNLGWEVKNVPIKKDRAPYDKSMKNSTQDRTPISDIVTITHSSNATVPETMWKLVVAKLFMLLQDLLKSTLKREDGI